MPNHPDRWLTLRDVCRVSSLSRTTVYTLISQGDFPKTVKVGSASRWSEADLMDWMARKHAESPTRRAA